MLGQMAGKMTSAVAVEEERPPNRSLRGNALHGRAIGDVLHESRASIIKDSFLIPATAEALSGLAGGGLPGMPPGGLPGMPPGGIPGMPPGGIPGLPPGLSIPGLGAASPAGGSSGPQYAGVAKAATKLGDIFAKIAPAQSDDMQKPPNIEVFCMSSDWAGASHAHVRRGAGACDHTCHHTCHHTL